MILLGTHALIWWADGNHLRLSANALAATDQEIESAGLPGGSPGLLVSAISCWEVAMLVNRGRLALNLDVERWLVLLASHPAVRLLALDPAVAVARPASRSHSTPIPPIASWLPRPASWGFPYSAPTTRSSPTAMCAASGEGSCLPHQRLHWPCWRSR